MECSQIPGWNEKGYLEPGNISEALKILNKGGISCSVLVGQTIPVIDRTPQDNEISQNTVKTIHAVGEAGVPTIRRFVVGELTAAIHAGGDKRGRR